MIIGQQWRGVNFSFFFFMQAKRAVQRGATAVIFDVSENPDAIDQVSQESLCLTLSLSLTSSVVSGGIVK